MTHLHRLALLTLGALWCLSWCACSQITDFDRFHFADELEQVEHDGGTVVDGPGKVHRDSGELDQVDENDAGEPVAHSDAGSSSDAGNPPPPPPASLAGTWKLERMNVNTGNCPNLSNLQSVWVLSVVGGKVSGSDDGLKGGIWGTVSGSSFELETSTSSFSGVFSGNSLTARELSEEGSCRGIVRMVAGQRQ